MKKVGNLIIVVCSVLFVLLLGVIVLFNIVYPPTSLISTSIGDIDISFKTNKQVINIIANNIKNTEYVIKLSDNSTEEKQYSEVIDSINNEKLLSNLKELSRMRFLFSNDTQSFDLADLVTYNKDNINAIISEISSKSTENIVESQNAYIGYNSENNEFEIVPEIYGNVFVDNCSDIFEQALKSFNKEIDFVELGCYVAPEVVKDNSILVNNLGVYNSYKDLEIVYTFGSNSEKINLPVFNSWLIPNYIEDGITLNGEKPFNISEDGIKSFVSELNKKYTTIGTPRNFTTSTGENITITNGDYGWILNRTKMIEDIKSHIISKNSETVEGIFSQKGALFGEKDFSNSYVEVSITNQRVWMYVNGECIVDTPVVTGNIGKNMGTRKGIFSLTYKTKNAVLRGADYETPVKYWMPFDGGIGLHDATWRGSFGGNIYKWNGSHGCVNMPLNAAKTVYENIDKSMPIIVW